MLTFIGAHLGETAAARFRRMCPNLPESSKIPPELKARITLDFQSSVPRCSRFQRTPSAGGDTTTTVGDTFANHARPTRAQRSSVSSAAETTTFTSTASRFQRRPSVSSAAETTTFTTSTAAHRAHASRFQRTSFSSANGTTTFTNTMSSGARYPDSVSYLSPSYFVPEGSLTDLLRFLRRLFLLSVRSSLPRRLLPSLLASSSATLCLVVSSLPPTADWTTTRARRQWPALPMRTMSSGNGS